MYEINYDDQRFQDVEKEKQNAIIESDEMYRGMVDASNNFYKEQIDATRDWTEKQTELQQEQTDFALEQIEQQKEEAEKDYIKEQKGAYVDWKKQSNKYDANAEQMASSGLQNSGYAESSQISMYNTYQNRVATARESWERAKLNYDNAIKEAQLQNSATLAEIAYQGLQQELQLSLQSFQYQNELLMAKASAKAQILGRADSQYQAVLNQMNTENALKEQIRQFNASQGGGIEISPDDEDGDEATDSLIATKVRANSVLDANIVLQLGLSGNERIYSQNGKYYIRTGKDENGEINYVEVPAKWVLPNPYVYTNTKTNTQQPIKKETTEATNIELPEPHRVTLGEQMQYILYGDYWLSQKHYDDWYEKVYGVRPVWPESGRDRARSQGLDN